MNRKHKPFLWWYHKIVCELAWSLAHIQNHKHDANNFTLLAWRKYYYHLNELCKHGFNLYGKRIKQS